MLSSPRLIVSAVVTSALALALFAGTASAAPKEIAYRCGPDICLLDPDNPGAVTNLTDNGATSYDEKPVWSPNGKRLAFVAKFSAKFPPEANIYTMEPDAPDQSINLATEVTHFTNGLVPTGELAWSPDGSKIAFVRGIASPGGQPLYVTNSDGSLQTAVPLAPEGGHPTWAPDSGKIAFWHSNQVYLTNADASSVPAPLAGAIGTEPAWSPDGSKIAFGFPAHAAEFLDLHVISASGVGVPVITPSFTQWIYASWSPSGGQIAYRATNPMDTEAGYVRVVNADGSGDHGLPLVQGLETRGSAASWSPDGSRLVFSGYLFGGDKSTKVYIGNSNGTGSVVAISGGESDEPAWRPNPVTNPGPPVITSSGGSSAPLPGPTLKPKVVWFTNRIPWTGGPMIDMLSVGCGGITCGVGVEGKMKGAVPAGLSFRPLLATATASAKPKKKPKPVVVGRGKVTVPANQTRKLKMRLTKFGLAVLEKVGKLKMVATVTTTAAGLAPVVETHTLTVVAKPAKPAKHGHKH